MTTMHRLVLLLVICVGHFLNASKIPGYEVRNAYKEMDVDGNGKVTLEEIKNHLQGKQTNPTADIGTVAQSIFEYYDKNKDGFVTLKEFLPRHDEL